MKLATIICIFFSLCMLSEIKSAEENRFYDLLEAAFNNTEGIPPIAYAVRENDVELVKFLIDRGEDPNLPTPAIAVYCDRGDYNVNMVRVGDEPGNRPLELAIMMKDLHLIESLLFYNLENSANPELTSRRYQHLLPYGRNYEVYDSQNIRWESPLQLSVSSENSEIVDLVIRGYRSPKELFKTFEWMITHDNVDFLQSWIKQNFSMWKDETLGSISEEVVHLFMSESIKDVIKEGNEEKLSLFIDYGWMFSYEEASLILEKKDFQFLNEFLKRARFVEGFNIYEMAIEKGLDMDLDLNTFRSAIEEIVKHGRVDLLEKFQGEMDQSDFELCFENAVKHGSLQILNILIKSGYYQEGHLVDAVKHNQPSIVEALSQYSSVDEIEDAIEIAYALKKWDLLKLLID